MLNLVQSKEEAIPINTDGFKIEYPKRKSENKELNQDLSDFTPPPEELFDCYVRSDTE